MSPKAKDLRGAARGKKAQLETWNGTYAELTELVREVFDFLEKKEGLKFSRNVLPPECHLVFSHPSKKLVVSVSSEYAGLPWMVVFAAGRNYPIDRLVKLLAPGEVAPKSKAAPTMASVRELLEFYARFLREHGRPIFDLDLEKLRPKRAR